MCGIVGLLVKKPELRAELGKMMVPMLVEMTERGPESAGLAVFTKPVGKDKTKYNLFSPDADFSWKDLETSFKKHLGSAVELTAQGNHAVLVSHLEASEVRAWLDEHFPDLHILSVGSSIDIYKDTGSPGDIAKRYHFENLHGTHLIGHTRMATESAVTPAHAHPFTSGEDFCLVHNGTISNPNMIRRELEPHGIEFDTDNDTEVACRYLKWRMQEGDTLQEAIHKGFSALDGFYTFLIGTQNELALVRDAFSCKPAVVAETDDYVAIASEFRSLAHLPGVKNAKLFEPSPEEVYVWKV